MFQNKEFFEFESWNSDFETHNFEFKLKISIANSNYKFQIKSLGFTLQAQNVKFQ